MEKVTINIEETQNINVILNTMTQKNILTIYQIGQKYITCLTWWLKKLLTLQTLMENI
jgi:hypothetical protein